MRWPREGRLWLLVAVLAVLLGILAALQYHWVGEIGRAERDRLQAALEDSARRLGGDIEREAKAVFMAFRVESRSSGSGLADACAERLAAWRERSDHPGIVSGLTLVARSGTGETSVATCEGGEPPGETTALPAELQPVLERLDAMGGERPRGRGPPGRWDFVVERPLALLVPIVEPDGDTGARPRFGAMRAAGVLVVRLDADYLRDRLLPQLTEARFGPLSRSDYSVAIVRTADQAVLFSNDPKLRPADRRSTDVRLPLIGRPGMWEEGRRPGPGGRPQWFGRPPESRATPDQEAAFPEDAETPDLPGIPGERTSRGGPPPLGAGGLPLELVVRHRGGSIDETVAALRRRNLGVSLGVLALLGTAALLLATSAQKARHLARQQLEFVAGVTHELHTPLAAIHSAGQNLADGIVADPEQVRRYGSLLGKESARLGELVAQVLDFAGIESGARPFVLAPVALEPLVEEVVRDLALVVGQAGVAVEKRIEAGLPEIEADATALRRALGNLLTNAVKFAAPAGLAVVRAQRSPDGRRLRLAVEDAGPGIPRAERERVFEPFFRGESALRGQVPGSGLGLSFVRHVAEAHGGRARIEPRPGGGTVVVMDLPLAGPGDEPR